MKTKRTSKAVALALVAGSVATLVHGNTFQVPSARLQSDNNPTHQPTVLLTTQNQNVSWVTTDAVPTACAR